MARIYIPGRNFLLLHLGCPKCSLWFLTFKSQQLQRIHDERRTEEPEWLGGGNFEQPFVSHKSCDNRFKNVFLENRTKHYFHYLVSFSVRRSRVASEKKFTSMTHIKIKSILLKTLDEFYDQKSLKSVFFGTHLCI